MGIIAIEELIFLDKKEDFRLERTTETGEFVPSYNVWTEPRRQRKRANELANVTKKKSEDRR